MRSLQWLPKKWSEWGYWLKTINASVLHCIMLNLVSKIQHWVRDWGLALVSCWSHIISIDLQWCIAFPIPTDTKYRNEQNYLQSPPNRKETWSHILFSSNQDELQLQQTYSYFNKLPVKSRSAVEALTSIPTTTDKGDLLPLQLFNRWCVSLAFANLWQIFPFAISMVHCWHGHTLASIHQLPPGLGILHGE